MDSNISDFRLVSLVRSLENKLLLLRRRKFDFFKDPSNKLHSMIVDEVGNDSSFYHRGETRTDKYCYFYVVRFLLLLLKYKIGLIIENNLGLVSAVWKRILCLFQDIRRFYRSYFSNLAARKESEINQLLKRREVCRKELLCCLEKVGCCIRGIYERSEYEDIELWNLAYRLVLLHKSALQKKETDQSLKNTLNCRDVLIELSHILGSEKSLSRSKKVEAVYFL